MYALVQPTLEVILPNTHNHITNQLSNHKMSFITRLFKKQQQQQQNIGTNVYHGVFTDDDSEYVHVYTASVPNSDSGESKQPFVENPEEVDVSVWEMARVLRRTVPSNAVSARSKREQMLSRKIQDIRHRNSSQDFNSRKLHVQEYDDSLVDEKLADSYDDKLQRTLKVDSKRVKFERLKSSCLSVSNNR